jgi:hypothetical protein
MAKTLKDLCLDKIIKKEIPFLPEQLPQEVIEAIKTESEKAKVVKELALLDAEKLCEKGCENKEIALLILKTPALYSKLGRYKGSAFAWLDEQAWKGTADTGAKARINAQYWVKLYSGFPDAEVAQYIADNFLECLSKEQQEALQKFIANISSTSIPHRRVVASYR